MGAHEWLRAGGTVEDCCYGPFWVRPWPFARTSQQLIATSPPRYPTVAEAKSPYQGAASGLGNNKSKRGVLKVAMSFGFPSNARQTGFQHVEQSELDGQALPPPKEAKEVKEAGWDVFTVVILSDRQKAVSLAQLSGKKGSLDPLRRAFTGELVADLADGGHVLFDWRCASRMGMRGWPNFFPSSAKGPLRLADCFLTNQNSPCFVRAGKPRPGRTSPQRPPIRVTSGGVGSGEWGGGGVREVGCMPWFLWITERHACHPT